MPPPTFSQVVTSTPVKRNTKDQGGWGSPPLFFASQPSQHTEQHRPLFEPSQVSPCKEDQPLFDPVTPERIHIHSQNLPFENTRKRLRPLTPPSEQDEPVQPLQTQAMFQTQIDIPRPSKRPRTRPILSPPTTASPPAISKTPIRASPVQGPSSGEVVVIPPPSVEKGLGNAKGLFDIDLNPLGMNTPEKKPPTLTELLASSQRSKPRPRPPSRKAPTTPSKSKTSYRPQMLVEDPVVEKVAEQPEEQLDEIPATPKTYFSSPASSTSSSASAGTLFNLRSKQARFSPPSSPMFTQHPETFNPTSTGTQIGEQRGRLIGQASLGRTGSLGMFGYNSQFDVDGHVDEVTAMLERDMDVDNWYKELQNYDADVGV
jgi:neural Wiskott-Aldrich syndrome protein